jgi:hypothetical protein
MRRHNDLAGRRVFGEKQFLTERQFLRFAVHPEEDRMTKCQRIYATFETFEEQLAHCYFMLHERFIANPQLSKFWAETAIDELQHASILRFCRERNLLAEADVDFNTVDHVEQLLETVKGIVSDVEVSVDEAFYAALLMESSELDDVYEKLIGALTKEHRPLVDAIYAGLRSHHAAFADAAAKFSGDRGMSEAFRNVGGRVS